jgi:predicted RNase H-like HicB family nuclease
MTTTYTAICRRSGDWWAVTVPELKGVHTQAKRLNQVEAMVREAIALFLDAPADSFDITVKPEVPPATAAAIKARREAADAEARANAATMAAVMELLERGLTVRDAGSLLDLSPQRVSQITTMAAKLAMKQRHDSDRRQPA